MIFYFSGTGNTRWAARQIADKTGDKTVNIADEMGKEPQTYRMGDGERLGFCFPTHGWQPPRLVREFIRRSRFVGATYVYALTTCGDSTGDAMTIFCRELQRKGLHADALFSVIMPESYVCLPFMYTDTPAREREKIEQARGLLAHIADQIDRRERETALTKGPTPWLFSYVIGRYFNRHMVSDGKFRVDEDVCTHCGKCQRVCPVANIKGTPPEWLHNGRCTCCLACYHHCPVHAINYGNITRKRGQYFMKEQRD